MLITKFNKMIRNRFLWAIFAVMICFAFVFSFGSGGCGDKPQRTSDSVARIYDEDVTPRDLMLARYFELGFRQNANLPPEAESMLRDRALQRIAKLRLAQQLGLSASDQELLEVIQRDPSFQQNNVFQQNLYRATIEQQLGIPVTVFESYLREEIISQKLQELVSSFTWISATEILYGLSDLTDRRTVAYTMLPQDTFTPEVEITPDDAEAYYNDNTNLFEVAEQISVRYVQFNVADFLDKAEVLDTNIVEYYNAHMEDYSSIDTNTEETVIAPMDAVRDEIISTLRDDLALEAATTTATAFVIQLMPGRYGQEGLPLDTAAANAGLTIHTSALFSEKGDVPGLDVDDSFRRAAFELDASDPAFSFSDAVVQKDSVYVLSLLERVEAHIQDFDSARDIALEMARSNAVTEAFSGRVAEVRDAIERKLDDGIDFASAVEEFALNVTTTQPFSVYGGFEDPDAAYAMDIPSAIATVDAGGLSEPVDVEGGVLLAYVVSRVTADAGTIDTLRPQFVSSMRRYRSAMAYRAFEGSVLDAAGYKSLTAVPEVDEDDAVE